MCMCSLKIWKGVAERRMVMRKDEREERDLGRRTQGVRCVAGNMVGKKLSI